MSGGAMATPDMTVVVVVVVGGGGDSVGGGGGVVCDPPVTRATGPDRRPQP